MAVTKKGPQRGGEGCVSTLLSVVKTAGKAREALTQPTFPTGIAEALQKATADGRRRRLSSQPGPGGGWDHSQCYSGLFWSRRTAEPQRCSHPQCRPKSIGFGHRVHKAISASGYANPTVARIRMLFEQQGFFKIRCYQRPT